MKYVLEDLLKIRKIREERAQTELLKKKQALEAAIRFVEQQQQELEEFKKWRLKEEDRIYEEAKGKLMSLDDLDNLRLQITLLREEEMLKAKQVEDAKKAMREAEQAYQKAKEDYKQITKDIDKVEEHKSIWMEEALREAERIADIEMEDFKSMAASEWEEEKEEYEWELEENENL